MSSKKIYTSVGLSEDIYARLKEEARIDMRPKSFIIEQALRNSFKLPWEREQEKKSDADKS